jgi:Flp pilus assembly protein TadG
MRKMKTNQGSAVVELVLLAPVLMVLTLFIVVSGRSGETLRQIQHAADHAARAASMTTDSRLSSVGLNAAKSDLAISGVSCRNVRVQTAHETRNGLRFVSVLVSCTVDHAGLSLLGLGSRTVSARSVEVIDVYRAS